MLLGQGMPAYGPLQRNIYNDENVEHYDYNPEKAKEILGNAGCTMGDDGFYERNGEEIGFVISVMSGEQDESISPRQRHSVAGNWHQLYSRYPGADGLGWTDGMSDRMGKPV